MEFFFFDFLPWLVEAVELPPEEAGPLTVQVLVTEKPKKNTRPKPLLRQRVSKVDEKVVLMKHRTNIFNRNLSQIFEIGPLMSISFV